MINVRERAMNQISIPGYANLIPLGRRGYDQDVANASAFLAAYFTGSFLSVTGGHIMPAI